MLLGTCSNALFFLGQQNAGKFVAAVMLNGKEAEGKKEGIFL